jgi:hypothetical protein
MEPSTVVALGTSVVQAISGLIGGNSTKKQVQELLNQRKAYETPDEVYDILHATQNNAQSGLDPVTLSYLTGQVDQAFAGGSGVASRMGADPNTLGALFEQKVNATMKIGAENHGDNMARYSQYLGALSSVANNKAAEYKSQQDILKDKIQAKVGEMRSYGQDVGNGLDTIVGSLAAQETANLYKPKASSANNSNGNPKPVFNPTSSSYTPSQWQELGSILNYSGNNNWASNALPYTDLVKTK